MKTQLFAALLPLVLFWAIEEFYGLKAALIVGCIAAVLELGWEKWRQGKVSFFTLSSNVLILGLGAVSFVMDSGIAFKLQPAVMELAMAALMSGMRLKGGEPFLIRTLKEAPMLDAEKRKLIFSHDWMVARIRAADNRFILFLIFHGLAVGWAAIWGSTRAWILLKGVLFYVLLVMVFVPLYRRPHGSTSASVPE